MKKGVMCIFLCTLLAATIVPMTAHGTSKMTPSLITGNTLYVGGSGPNNFTRIQDAIDNASDGDIVFVYSDSSPYRENLVIKKPLFLLGEQKETTLILGRNGTDDFLIHVQRATGVTIEGFSLFSNTSIGGIMAVDSPGLIISNNVLDHPASSGIDIQFCDNAIITNNFL